MSGTVPSHVAPSDGWWGDEKTGPGRAPTIFTEHSHVNNAAPGDEVKSGYRNPNSSYQDEDDIDRPPGEDFPLCFCGMPSIVLVSRSERNPNRPFYKCSKYKDDPTQCKFFLWQDEAETTTKSPSRPPMARRRISNATEAPVYKPSNTTASQSYSLPLDGATRGTCFKCGQEGHWARDCPSTLGGGSTQPISAATTSNRHAQYNNASNERSNAPYVFTSSHYNNNYNNNYKNNDATTENGAPARGSCFKCGSLDHWARDCPGPSNNYDTNTGGGMYGASNRGGGGGSQYTAGHGYATTTTNNAAKGRTGACYKCGSEDHWSRDCPNGGGGSGGGGGANTTTMARSNACYKCGSSDHWSRDCPNGGGGSGGGSGGGANTTMARSNACYKCGASDHWAKDCPQGNGYGGTKRAYNQDW